jgi:hypothetical protein
VTDYPEGFAQALIELRGQAVYMIVDGRNKLLSEKVFTRLDAARSHIKATPNLKVADVTIAEIGIGLAEYH